MTNTLQNFHTTDLFSFPYLYEENVPIPLKTGGLVRCNIYRPKSTDRVPVLVTYGPYGKDIHCKQLVTRDSMVLASVIENPSASTPSSPRLTPATNQLIRPGRPPIPGSGRNMGMPCFALTRWARVNHRGFWIPCHGPRPMRLWMWSSGLLSSRGRQAKLGCWALVTTL